MFSTSSLFMADLFYNQGNYRYSNRHYNIVN